MSDDVIKALGKLGMGGIAIFLVWKLTAGLDVFAVRMQALETQSAAQHQEIKDHSARTEDLTGRAYMLNEKMLLVLRAMCVQDAKTADDRRDCLRDN